jgi:2-aminoethylphosphonate-pyruvate transaminase
MILLNPGPVNLSDRVRQALLKPDLCHREPEFFELQDSIRRRLVNVYDLDPDQWTAVLISGSGSSAMEAMVSSLLPENGHLMVIENGVYGERLSNIASVHNIPLTKMHLEWGAEIVVQDVQAVLDKQPAITHLAVVHHETTTGRLNPLNGLGRLCAERNIELLVDAVSSFGGEALDFDADAITACAGTANKCLHGIPGLAFVMVRRSVLAQQYYQQRTLYLDLKSYYNAQEKQSTPFTPAIPAFYALDEALAELQEAQGWSVRHQQYRQLADKVSDGLAEQGIELLLPGDVSSVVLRSYHLPPGLSYQQLHDALKQEGFVIYAGQQQLENSIFRISTMGTITSEDIDRLLQAFNALDK